MDAQHREQPSRTPPPEALRDGAGPEEPGGSGRGRAGESTSRTDPQRTPAEKETDAGQRREDQSPPGRK
jgi:hypothetical protein